MTKIDETRERYVIVLHDAAPEGFSLPGVEPLDEEVAGKIRIPCYIEYGRLLEVKNHPLVERVEPVILYWTG